MYKLLDYLNFPRDLIKYPSIYLSIVIQHPVHSASTSTSTSTQLKLNPADSTGVSLNSASSSRTTRPLALHRALLLHAEKHTHSHTHTHSLTHTRTHESKELTDDEAREENRRQGGEAPDPSDMTSLAAHDHDTRDKRETEEVVCSSYRDRNVGRSEGETRTNK